MRHLPKQLNEKQNLIVQACFDYYGGVINEDETKSAKKIALFLMGRRKGTSLSEDELSDFWAIKINLSDRTYTNSFK